MNLIQNVVASKCFTFIQLILHESTSHVNEQIPATLNPVNYSHFFWDNNDNNHK
jgi:hypothetical protein